MSNIVRPYPHVVSSHITPLKLLQAVLGCAAEMPGSSSCSAIPRHSSSELSWRGDMQTWYLEIEDQTHSRSFTQQVLCPAAFG